MTSQSRSEAQVSPTVMTPTSRPVRTAAARPPIPREGPSGPAGPPRARCGRRSDLRLVRVRGAGGLVDDGPTVGPAPRMRRAGWRAPRPRGGSGTAAIGAVSSTGSGSRAFLRRLRRKPIDGSSSEGPSLRESSSAMPGSVPEATRRWRGPCPTSRPLALVKCTRTGPRGVRSLLDPEGPVGRADRI